VLAFVLALTVGSPAAAAFAKSGPITFYFGLKRPDVSAQKAFFDGFAAWLVDLSALPQPEAGVCPVWGHARGAASVRASDQAPRPDRADRRVRGVCPVRGPVTMFDRAFAVRITREFENDPNIYAYAVPGNGRLHLPAALSPLARDVNEPRRAFMLTLPRRRELISTTIGRDQGQARRRKQRA
jgi:hypothetical protein